MIKFKNVYKKITKKHAIVYDDLTISDGAFVNVFGKTGSGKTTLLSLIMGKDPFSNEACKTDNGHIKVKGNVDYITWWNLEKGWDETANPHVCLLDAIIKSINDGNSIILIDNPDLNIKKSEYYIDFLEELNSIQKKKDVTIIISTIRIEENIHWPCIYLSLNIKLQTKEK